MRATHSTIRRHCLVRLLILVILFGGVAPATEAQSGRRKGEPNKNPTSIDVSAAPSPTPKTASSEKAAQGKKDSARQSVDDNDDVVRVNSNLVPVPASVIDSKGYALTSLKLEDFELRVDGELKPISEISYAETPVRMAMLFDNSGSLLAFRDIEKQAASGFFRRVLRPIDLAAIYSVASDYYLAQPLTNDVRRLEQTISGFGKPEGGTPLFDAIVEASGYLRPYHGRKVIVIVSDGADNISHFDFETTLQRVQSDDCEIYVVQTGLYESANVRDLAAERRMETLAAQTGGAVFLPKTSPDLEVAFEELAADLAQQYVLSYYATEQIRDGQYHTIVLRVKTRKDARVRSRRGFYAPRAS